MRWLFQQCSNGSNTGAAVYYQLSLEIIQKQGKLPSPTKSSVVVDLCVSWELLALLMVELGANDSVCVSL